MYNFHALNINTNFNCYNVGDIRKNYEYINLLIIYEQFLDRMYVK